MGKNHTAITNTKSKHRGIRLKFDRVLSHDLMKQAIILACLFCILFIISFILLSFSNSEWEAFCDKHNLPKWLLPLYLLIDPNIFNNLYTASNVNGWMLFASGITYLAGLFVFNGMIISLMTNAISSRVERHNYGLIHYLQSGHYIIMGYDDICPSIINDIFSTDKDAYILILTSANPVKIKEKLRRTIGDNALKHIIINYGHRISKDEYNAIHLESAKEIFIVGHRELPAHDAINIECVDNICEYLKDAKPVNHPYRITCVFEDLDTYAAFKTSEIFEMVRELDIEFVPYNFYADWARQVFVKRCHKHKQNSAIITEYPSVYGNGIKVDDDKFVHLVFVGTTNFATAFAIEAAHVLHFPNFTPENKRRTRITFIDLNADKERHIFITRNHHLFDIQAPIYRDLSESGNNVTTTETQSKYGQSNFLDVEFEFIKGDIFSEKIRSKLVHWAKDYRQYLSIFLAMSNQRNNFTVGMNMPDEIYDAAIPLFIRQNRSDNFVTNLRQADSRTLFTYSKYDSAERQLLQVKRKGRYANIYPFGMCDTGYSSDHTTLIQAKLINYIYDIFNKFSKLDVLTELQPDQICRNADEAWRRLNVAEKWSNLYCAYGIVCKISSLRAMRGLQPDDAGMDMTPLTENEIKIMARVEQNRWNVEKLLMGYRKARPEEDNYEHEQYAEQLCQNKHLFIHHDIRPFTNDKDADNLNREFARYIPWIIETAAKIENISKQQKTIKIMSNTYKPNPIDLSDVILSDELRELQEAIAENAHEVWAMNRRKDGWTYGPQRNDALKQTPNMIPYAELPDEEKLYDREMAMNTIKLLQKLGYDLVKRHEYSPRTKTTTDNE